MSDRKITLHPSRKNVAYLNYNGEQQPIFFYEQGVNVQALVTAYRQLDNLLSYHRKVTVILLQLHQAIPCSNNREIKLLLQNLKKKAQAKYAVKRFAYAWAREEGYSGGNQHYHIAVMLDGSVCQHGYYMASYADEIWRNIHPDNYSWFIKNSTFNLRRTDDNKQLRIARMRMSYAAKLRTKALIPKGTSAFGSSRIR